MSVLHRSTRFIWSRVRPQRPRRTPQLRCGCFCYVLLARLTCLNVINPNLKTTKPLSLGYSKVLLRYPSFVSVTRRIPA
jgi:hypothetical protein